MFTNRIINITFIVLCLVFAVILGSLLLITRARTNQIIDELSIDRVKVSMNGFYRYLDNLAHQAMNRAEILSKQERLIDAINEYNENGFVLTDENYEVILGLANEFLYGFDFLSITDMNGIALARTDNGEYDYPLPKNGYSLLANPDVQKVFETGEQVSSISFMLDNTTFISTTLYPIYDGDTLIGIITCLYNLTDPKYILAYKEQSGSEVAIFLGREEFISTLTYRDIPGRVMPGEAVFEAIYENNEEEYISFTPIDGVMYGTEFAPLIYHGEIIGMIFTGVDIDSAMVIRSGMELLTSNIAIVTFVIVIIFLLVIFRYSRVLRRQIRMQNLMTRISQSFLSDADINDLIENAFREIGKHMGVSSVLLYTIKTRDPYIFNCTNEWTEPSLSVQSRIGDKFVLTDKLIEVYRSLEHSDRPYISSDDKQAQMLLGQYRKNFPSFLSVCIFLDDGIYAIIDFSRKKTRRKWSKDDINISAFVSNILTGAFHRKRVEQRYITAKETAERNSHYKTSFLANVSHELRTPMNAILGITEICLREKKSREDIINSLNMIYDSGNMLMGIVNDILDLSKIEAGKMEIVPVNYSVPSLINDTVQLCRLRYGSKPIDFILDIDKNMPLNLIGDEVRIKQIFNNIISNAFKYTDTGEIKMSISADTNLGSHEVPAKFRTPDSIGTVMFIIRVKDTGRGMTPEQLEMLYDEFVRFDVEHNRGTIGTGLGMSITKQLVEMMNGEIHVESESGKGTAFTIHLPQQQADPAVCGPDMSDKLNSFRYHSISLAKKAQVVCEYMPYGKVLVVDDVESNLFVAKGMLIPYGLQIDTATSGFEAIDYIAEGRIYDVIYMDHMMPKMNGIDTVKNIREMGYKGTIIALTANAIVGQAEMFLQNGFDGYIPKPIDSREINTTLIEHVRNKQKPEVVNAAREEAREAELLKTLEPDDDADDIDDTANLDLIECFLTDAENAVSVLEQTLNFGTPEEADELDLYRITTHGMKNALRNVGEKELGELSYELEKAAASRDVETITAKTPEFLFKLKSLIEKLSN